MCLCLTKQSSSHLAHHVSHAVVVVSLLDFFCTLHSHSKFDFLIVPFTWRLPLRRSTTRSDVWPLGYEPNDLAELNNTEVTPMFFHRPSVTSASILLRVLLLPLLNRIWTMSRYGTCWLHHCTYRREKQVQTDDKFITPAQRKLCVKFMSFPSKCRETCSCVLTQKKVESRISLRQRR